MAIKNRDGTTYFFSKPNPLMNEQNLWNEKIILNNKFGKKIVESEPEIVYISTEEDEDVIDVWCLPAIDEKNYDDKFIFKAIVYDNQDLFIKLIAKQKINELSIIYPKNSDRRWWKVIGNEIYEEKWFLVVATISDYHPSFT